MVTNSLHDGQMVQGSPSDSISKMVVSMTNCNAPFDPTDDSPAQYEHAVPHRFPKPKNPNNPKQDANRYA
jgi:hypothetical protein